MVPSATRSFWSRQESHEFRAKPGNVSETLSQNKKINKRAEGMAQVIECLSNIHQALSKIPSSAKNNNNK
jgi:hypothetical protein